MTLRMFVGRFTHRLGVVLIVALLAATLQERPAGAQERGPQDEAPPAGVARSTALAQAVGETTTYVDAAGNQVLRVDDGFDLDRYMFRSDGPLNFSIDVQGDYGPVDAEGHPVEGNVLFGETGRLTLRVFDIDDDYAGTDVEPEIDLVFVNGITGLFTPRLSGADNQWSISTVTFPMSSLKLPTPANPNGTNDFEVLIDTANTGPDVWAAEVDWAELRVAPEGLTPLAMIHGFNSDGGAFLQMQTYYEVLAPELRGRIIRPDLTNHGGIRVNMDLMKQPIADLLDQTAWGNIHILAHSMGGLDSRLYAWEHPNEVRKLLMLGTPNGGTALANVICGLEDPFIATTIFGGSSFIVRQLLEFEFGECGGIGDAIFELTEPYVQLVFNPQVLDRQGTSYSTIAGTRGGPFSFILDGEDDNIVAVSSVQFLDFFQTDGLHVSAFVFHLNHSGVRDPDTQVGPESICLLYRINCVGIFPSPEGAAARATALPAPASTQVSDVISETLAAGETVSLPVSFDGAPNATIVLVGEGITADLDGTSLETADLFETQVLAIAPIAPEDGTLTIRNTSAIEQNVAGWVSIDTDRSLQVATSPTLASPGQEVTVTVTLSGSQPADAPIAQVTDDGGNVVADVALTASGVDSWTGSFTAPGAGIYTVAGGAPGDAPRFGTTLLSVASGGAVLSGTTSEFTPDDNANGLLDSLTITTGISVSAPGTYRLAGRLVDAAGQSVATAGAIGDLSAGAGSLDLVFDGEDIFASGLSGPYELVDVVLSRGDLSLEQMVASVMFTGAYDYRSFEHFAVEIDVDGFFDLGVDNDDDGFFDLLSVGGSVRVDQPGSYAINALLVAADGTELGEFATIASLVAGDNPINLTFPWSPIAAAGIDGPYIVQDLSIYPTASADVLGFLVRAHTTLPYSADGQVAGPVTFDGLQELISELQASGDISNGGIAQSMLSKVANASERYDEGNINAAINVLEALRNQLSAQRGKALSESGFQQLESAVVELIATL